MFDFEPSTAASLEEFKKMFFLQTATNQTMDFTKFQN
jgi:hypothetical protein